MTRQPPFTFPKINIPALELGSVAQGKLRTLQRAGWVISGYALQQHTDALWPMRSALVTDGYFGMLPDENQPEAAAAETCEISQTAKLRNAMRLLHEVSAEFFVDGHDLEYEDGDHPLVDRVRAFLAGAPTPEADGYPPLPRGTDAGACMSDAQVFTASEMRAYVDADRAMRECGVRSALQTIHDTFKADLSAGYITRDKEFAVSIAHEALAATPTPAPVIARLSDAEIIEAQEWLHQAQLVGAITAVRAAPAAAPGVPAYWLDHATKTLIDPAEHAAEVEHAKSMRLSHLVNRRTPLFTAPQTPTDTFEQRMSDWAQEDSIDAERWREVCMHVGAAWRLNGQHFTIDSLQPCSEMNLMRGGVVEHFTKAVDASAAQRKEPPCS